MTLRAGRRGAWAVALLLAAGAVGAEERAAVLKKKSERLAEQARALAKTDGCQKVEECAVAGFGHRACGGPREYIAYCTRTTNEKTLQARLDALAKAEKAWQAEAGIMSICSLAQVPVPQLVDGKCQAQ